MILLTSFVRPLWALSKYMYRLDAKMLSTKRQAPVISFIGGGNMAEAILGGLHRKGYPGSHLRYAEPLKERREYMLSTYPDLINVATNDAAVDDADIVVLAVKPQVLRQVLVGVGPAIQRNPSCLLLSIAGGITTGDMSRWLNGPSNVPIVRGMPNTPAMVGEGAMGLYATDSVNQEQRNMTEEMMRTVSKEVIWVEEERLMDSVTGLSGSGPAYFFLMMEAMQDAGVAAGLTPEEAKALTLQTCLGAARMAQESTDDLATLRRKVTSPNGTTEAAIKSLEGNSIRKVIKEAVLASKRRAEQLAIELGRD